MQSDKLFSDLRLHHYIHLSDLETPKRFCLTLIGRHYYADMDVFILMYFPVYELASIGFTLVRFKLTKDTGVPKNYVLW